MRANTLMAVLAPVFLAAACDTKDAQILTDTSAAGSADAGTAEQEQIYAAAARIRQALSADSTLHAFDVEADKHQNRIVIEGTVPAEQHKALAAQIAQRYAGGIQVENRIRIEGK